MTTTLLRSRNGHLATMPQPCPQVTALAALVRELNRHLDTVGVRGTTPLAGALRLRDDRQVWRCAVATSA
jgi:hypothetical protein